MNKVQLNKSGTFWVWNLLQDTINCLRYLCMNVKDSLQCLSTTQTVQKPLLPCVVNSNAAEELYQWQISCQLLHLDKFQNVPLEII